MPRPSRFQAMQIAFSRIKELFKEEKGVYLERDIKEILDENRYRWLLPNILTLDNFTNFLIERNIIKSLEIEIKNKKVKRYISGNVSNFSIALSLEKNSYLCHYSAIYLHNLTENIPKNIYINVEQKDKGLKNNENLIQENIDRAFSRPMRLTNKICTINDSKVFILNGKNVQNIGVKELYFEDEVLKITNMERTLIDITVRPSYAGGVNEVLNAYILAKGKISVNKLLSILKTLNYTYPYHQSIGFYLEKAGYSEKVIKLVEKIEIKNDFYLTYQMKEKEYSKKWRLFFPRGI